MKYRVKFSKTGPIRFIGHLDVMRFFQKVIRRSHLPIAYTEGFSPHQILSFAFPLSVGYTSEGEYFDMELTEDMDEKTVFQLLNDNLVDGFEIKGIKKLGDNSGNCMALVFAATYKVTLKESIKLPNDYTSQFYDLFGQSELFVDKPKKKGGGFININLKEFLYDYKINDKELIFTVNASSSNNIKPSFVVDCYLNSMHIDIPEFAYNIHRIDILGNTGSEEDINLVSMLDMN